jgi:hypothetical protein
VLRLPPFRRCSSVEHRRRPKEVAVQKDVPAKSRTKRVSSEEATFKKKGAPRPIYALTQWTVQRRSRGWYISSTIDRLSHGGLWRGPYSSNVSACLAISKQLAKEARERHHCMFHRVDDDLA